MSRDITFEEDIAYQRSRHAESDSDEQEATQEMLAFPSLAVEKESMEEDDSIPPTSPVDLFVSDSDLVDPTVYRQLVGSLIYLVNTRLDICFTMSTLRQFMCESREMHWVAAEHVLRYLRGIVGYGLRCTSSSDLRLVSYSNSDWVGNVEEWKSTSECCFSLGSAMVSQFSRKQSVVALSTTEVEYIATCMAACEAVWLRKLLVGLFGQRLELTVIHCGNQSCVKMNPIQHDRMKHVEMKYHYVREMVQRCVVEMSYVPTDEQIADVLMKPLGRGKFAYFRDKIGVMENVSLAERSVNVYNFVETCL